MFREGIKKAKVQVELNLVRVVKNNTKRLFRYISQKRLAKESVPPLMNEKGKLASSDMRKGLRYSISSLLWSSLTV